MFQRVWLLHDGLSSPCSTICSMDTREGSPSLSAVKHKAAQLCAQLPASAFGFDRRRFAPTRERVDGTIQHARRRDKLYIQFVSMTCYYSSLLSPSHTYAPHASQAAAIAIDLILFGAAVFLVGGTANQTPRTQAGHARGCRYEAGSTFLLLESVVCLGELRDCLNLKSTIYRCAVNFNNIVSFESLDYLFLFGTTSICSCTINILMIRFSSHVGTMY